MANWWGLRAGIERLEQRREDRRSDRGQWDWYAEGCPCGLPAGECREHPRARANQRPPAGDWRTWLLLMGRGAGKTRSAAEWVRQRVESGTSRRIALVGATAADVRDTMVDGESGILAISPPWSRPRYEPSRRRLTWPNGARATTFSAEEPDRLRGPQHDCAWLDELAAFRYPEAMDNLLFGLRLGRDPRLCVTTTPRPTRLVTDLIADPKTAIARGTTFENRANLAPAFFERIVSQYEGTRLGQQELLAEVIEISDGLWFHRFDAARHVTEAAEYDSRFPAHLAIDCGVSRHVGAVWFQVRGSTRSIGGSRSSATSTPRACIRRPRPRRSGPAGSSCPARGGSTRCDWTRRRRRGRASARRPTASSSASSAGGRPPDGRATASPTASTSSRSCSSAAYCSSTPAAPRLSRRSRTTPAAGPAAATGSTSRPTPSTLTRPDGRTPRRRPRPLPRRPDRTDGAAIRPRGAGVLGATQGSRESDAAIANDSRTPLNPRLLVFRDPSETPDLPDIVLRNPH